MARAQQRTGRTRPKSKKKAAPMIAKEVRKRTFQMKLERFADEYLIDLNGAAAAVRASYSKHTADVKASQLLARADVQEMIAERQAARSKRTGITADSVFRLMYGIATADATEFSEIVIDCCRYCYGKNFRYQRTPREMEIHRQEWQAKITRAANKRGDSAEQLAEALEDFDEEGGVGFNRSREPHPQCPECFGQGIARAVIKQTAKVSASAKLAFGYAKQTDKTLECRLRDQDAMLIKVAEHLGMFKKRVEINAGDGKDTKPERAYVIIPAKAVATDDLIG